MSRPMAPASEGCSGGGTGEPSHVPPLRFGPECVAAVQAVRPDHVQSLKELARHTLHRTGLSGVIHRRQSRRGFRSHELISADVAATFEAAYRRGGWVHADDQESRSGIGSSAAVTAGLVERLGEAMARLGCRSLVDVGCGDWNWLGRSDFSFDYTGIDIVPEVIEANRRHERPGVRFAVADAIQGPIPEADFALCREVLFHLSFAHARKVIANIKRAARYLAATTDLDLWCNSDIRTGDFRRINLLRRPYRFPPPVCLIADEGLVPTRRLAVWETGALCN